MRDGRGHLLIAGTGRAGTTLLVRILTRLGLDTGWTAEDVARAEASPARAGLERPLTPETAPSLPVVIKNPNVVDVLPQALDDGWLRIDHAVLPVRELGAAAESRRAATRRWAERGVTAPRVAGGLWKTADPDRQEEVLAVQLHRVLEALVSRDVSVTLLSFPRFARDPDHLVRGLGPYLRDRFGLSPAAIAAAHRAEVRPELIGAHAS